MKPRSNPKQRFLYATLFAFVCASLLCALMPCVPANATTQERWSGSIDTMLSAGDYAQGEAIVALLATKQASLAAQGELPLDELEPLMEVSAHAAGIDDVDGLVPQAEQDVTLTLATSNTLSTEELLRALANDPRVAFAEPNYLIDICDGESGPAGPEPSEASSTAADESLVTAQAEAGNAVADLRELQWDNWDTTSIGTKPIDALENRSLNVPNFQSNEVGGNMDNEVVVAILDDAIDFSNPDLAERAYTFNPELQAQLGCEEHGFNACGEVTDGKNVNHRIGAHGTHCAGVIGAAWDGKGVSGVASNAKIVSIQMLDGRTERDNNRASVANGLRAFDFIKRANEAGVGIRITSNSWGHYQTSKALNAAILELGKAQGVISVFAASNEGLDNDAVPITSSTFVDNPYVIVVTATDQLGNLASEYNYGAHTVDIAAPGISILSTVTQDRASYIPAALPASNILYEEFEESDPIVTIQQIDKDENYVSSPGVPCTDMHFVGRHGIAVPIDAGFSTGLDFFDRPIQTFRFDFDLEKSKAQTGVDVIGRLRQAQDLYFGFSLCIGKAHEEIWLESLRTTASGDEKFWNFSKNVLRGGVLSPVSMTLTGDDVALDFDHLDGHLFIDLGVVVPDGCDVLYMDSLGIGSHKVPYAFLQGTSMACPHVAGAAAVLSSQTGLEGADLASLVRSKARIPNEGPLALRTGGVFDFTVGGSADDATKALSPTIDSIEVAGTTVTINGTDFGSDAGTAELSRYVVCTEGTACASSVTSWSGTKVVVELEDPFEGILDVRLTTAAGKQDNSAAFVSKGEMVYEQDLPFTSDTGEPYLFDGMGDYETRGPLVGLGCKLYYLPADQRTELSPVYQRMCCFDLKTQTWSDLPGLPEVLQGTSAVLYEGKLVVEGATVQTLPAGDPTNEFVGGEPEERVYVYDPATSSWSQASSDGMYVGQTIVNDDGQLKLVGATRPYYDEEYEAYSEEAVPVCSYDVNKGLVEELTPLVSDFKDPEAVIKDGVIYLVDYSYNCLMIVRDGKAETYDYALPESTRHYVDTIIQHGVLVVAADGIMLVGPPALDGSSDTYVLREKDGDAKFEPYEKRASEARVGSVAACAYRGRLFAIGSSWVEPNQRLFRATALGVPEYPGDIPCEQGSEPESKPDPTPGSGPASPNPTSTPKPTQGTTSASQPAASPQSSFRPTMTTAFPKTRDATTLVPTILGICVCGALALSLGIAVRKGVDPSAPQR